MRRNKCRNCELNNVDLADYCFNLDIDIKDLSNRAFTLSVYAQSLGGRTEAQQLRELGMLLARCDTLQSLLSQELYRGPCRRLKRRRR